MNFDGLHDFVNRASVNGTALLSLLGADFLKMVLASIFGAVLSYVVIVTRLDERVTNLISDTRQNTVRIEMLDRKAATNEAVNATQNTTLDLRNKQRDAEWASVNARLDRLEQEIRAHELDDRRAAAERRDR